MTIRKFTAHLTLAVIAGIVASAPGLTPAQAQGQANASFEVTANVPAVCSVATANLDFGNYLGAQLDAVATATITCNATTTAWEVGFDPGRHSTTSSCASRSMESPLSILTHLNYNIFDDAGRQNTLGAKGETGCFTHTGTGSANRNVFGRIPGGQTPPIGGYSDIVTVTIYW